MAISLNGTTEYLNRTSGVVSAYPFSVSAWIYPTANTTYYYIWSLGSSTTTNVLHALVLRGDVAGDPVEASSQNTTYYAAQSSTGITINQWWLVVGVWASATSRKVYLKQRGTAGSSGTNTTSVTFPTLNRTTIGAVIDAGVAKNFFPGRIGSVALWNAALTDQDAQSLADVDPWPFIAPCPLSYWPLGGKYGNHYNDIMAAGNHMTSVG